MPPLQHILYGFATSHVYAECIPSPGIGRQPLNRDLKCTRLTKHLHVSEEFRMYFLEKWPSS